MRQIKYRAWEPTNEKMVHVTQLDFINKSACVEWDSFVEIGWSLEDLKLMQYTGLKDKNGKGIYESDIVDDNFIGIGFVEFLNGAYRVNYQNGSCKWFIDFLDSEKKSLEIIGNIYENPELLQS